MSRSDPLPDPLAAFLAAAPAVARVRLARVAGSAPREAGAEMLVAPDALWGTVGGGQLEHRAVAAARALLADGGAEGRLDLPLGPEIGQCCGGRVEVALEVLDDDGRAAVLARTEAARAARPAVHLFGAGHVNRAVAAALAPLPVRVRVMDERADELARLPGGGTAVRTALPEAELRAARAGDAVVVATHDHGLDFLVTEAALARGDLAYVGLIGSATKRARFERQAEVDCAALVCPIGAGGGGDKRPEVIAAFVAAEVMAALIGAREGAE